jgi:hypothetical protein
MVSGVEGEAVKGYRTVLVNAALLGVALTDYLIADGQLVGLVVSNPKAAGLIVAAVNLLNIALRFVTTGPVGKK